MLKKASLICKKLRLETNKGKKHTCYFHGFIFISPGELSVLGMFKNNEAFHFMASHAHVCLDFKDQT